MDDNLQITNLLASHAEQIAALHIDGIKTGFISSLGEKFVTALYQAIANDKSAFGAVAVQNERVVGFVAFTENIKSLYRSILLKKGFGFAVLLITRLLSFARIKKIFETILYPGRTENKLPTAELLSIVVSADYRGKGLATRLITEGLSICRRRNIEKVKVLVAADNTPANSLYVKCGFEPEGQIDNHGVKSNIYVAAI